jgi:hypothetical protein
MRLIFNALRLLLGLFIVASLFSCENNIIKKRQIKKIKSEIICSEKINIHKKKFSPKDKDVIRLFNEIKRIDLLVKKGSLTTSENTVNKFGSFIVYNQNNKSIKLISEIYVRNLHLASIKHEIYFIDDCTIVTKMTKYAYRSKRLKAIYYYSFYKGKYVGCIVESVHTIFKKREKWTNISDEKVAIDWSSRIYNNIIKPHLNSLKGR